MSRSTYVEMDSVMDGFKTVTGATAISDCMVAEGLPVVNAGQHVVNTRSKI